MKVRVHVKKIISLLGDRMVELTPYVDEVTNFIFINHDSKEFKLRKVINGCFVTDGKLYSNYAVVKVKNDEEIDDMIKKIFDMYKKVYDKEWRGEYIVEKEL
jgi:hypothetical protein